MDRRLKLENLNCLILEFFFSKIYFLDQIYWQALVRPFKWHIGKVCIISRKKVTESGKNVKKGLKFVLFHFFDNENGENIFFGPSQLKVPKRWVLMVLKVFQCLLKQKSYKPNKIFLDLLSTNWAFEPLWINVQQVFFGNPVPYLLLLVQSVESKNCKNPISKQQYLCFLCNCHQLWTNWDLIDNL